MYKPEKPIMDTNGLNENKSFKMKNTSMPLEDDESCISKLKDNSFENEINTSINKEKTDKADKLKNHLPAENNTSLDSYDSSRSLASHRNKTKEQAKEDLQAFREAIGNVRLSNRELSEYERTTQYEMVISLYRTMLEENIKLGLYSDGERAEILRNFRNVENRLKVADYMNKKAAYEEGINELKFKAKTEETEGLAHGVSYEDDLISKEQKDGVRACDRWLVHKITETKCDYVMSLLSRPLSERLFVYYSIERQRTGQIDEADVVISQTKYAPSLEGFKEQLLASKFKFWRRLAGKVYWEKLNAAEDELPLFRRINQERDKDHPDFDIASQHKDLKKEESKQKYNNFIASVAERRDFEFKYDKMDSSLQKANKAKLKELKDEEKECQGELEAESLEKIKELVKEGGKAGEIAKGIFNAYLTNAKLVTDKFKTADDLITGSVNTTYIGNKDAEEFEIEGLAGDIFSKVSNIAAVNSMIAFVSVAYDYYKNSKKREDWNAMEKTQSILELLKFAAFSVKCGGKITKNVAGFVGSKGIASTAKTVGKYAGYTVNGLAHIANLAAHYNIHQGKKHIGEAEKLLKKSKLFNKAGTEVLTEDEKKKKMRSEAYEEGMIKLAKRNLHTKNVKAYLDTASNTMMTVGLATTSVGVGGLMVALNAVVTVTKEELDAKMKKGTRLQTIDNFIGIEGWAAKYGVNTSDSKAMDRLRRRLVGRMGFATLTRFFNHITNLFGNQVYDKLFGEEFVPERPAYVEFVQGLGLKYDYETKHPTKKSIVSKLRSG